jgi:aspartyl-tRNA(Asn)/glutamyl-tRNA(Gln) amidotransferase subunit A
MHTKTLAQLSSGLLRREFSSQELTRAFLERITRFNPEINAYVTVTEELALAQAQRADQRIAAGLSSALTGIPIAQKDIFCTQGVRTSCGSRMLDNFISPYDATVVERYNQAGSVMLGKLNMDEFAMGSSNETSYYGPVKNPWDTGTVPGGSSGGSAAAISAGLTAAATGTDTGGSIRQPAAFCGITGLKPTYGRVSRYGMIAFASSLDQAGPMAKTAEDCALMLQAMAGFDERDSTSVDHPVPDYAVSLNESLEGLKIGLPKEFFGEGLDADIARNIDAAIAEYRKLGATVHEISLPHMHLSVPAYYVVAPAECSSNLARFDGVRYGYRCDNPKDLSDLYTRSRGEGFGAEVKRRILIGTYVLSAGYYDAYYLKAQKIRRLISEDFRQAFQQVDVIMGPTAPSVAFRFGEKGENPLAM